MANDKAFKVKNGLELGAYDAVISSTAVDVFVYDTSKDSDGGAWRKRTQHTSWYNETLNTATRGSRREFPAVAVIVAEVDSVTIYDGDDPSLPMWMVFNFTNFGASSNLLVGNTRTSVSLAGVNAIVTVGVDATSGPAIIINFASDIATMAYQYTGYGVYNSIGGRNSGLGYSGIGYVTVDNTVNDVAMTVLPDAPIDPATGLPVPTIAVATDGGVSVITNSGAVYDSAYTGNVDSISFTDDNGLLFALHSAASNSSLFLAAPDVFVSDGWASTTIGGNSGLNGFPVLGTTANDSLFSSGLSQIAQAGGLSKILWNSTENQSLLNYTTSTYNTGWMNGDIKGAFLSSTDATSLAGTLFNSNSSFNTDVTGVTPYSGASISHDTGGDGGRLKVTSDGTQYCGVRIDYSTAIESGKTYMFQMDYTVGTYAGNIQLNAESQNTTPVVTTSTSGTYRVYLESTYSGTASRQMRVRFNDAHAAGEYFFIDNVIIKEVERDRSVNANHLVPFGTVTRSPVATGAELVAYSGFSASNYLEQPYNSDLDFGTGDFCVMGWHKSTGANVNADILYRGKTSPASDDRFFQVARWANGSYRFTLGRQGITSDGVIYVAGNLTNWVHICGIVRSGVIELYLNGNLVGTDPTTIDVSQTDAVLRIGRYTYDMHGSAALWRISATAPTAEQIKKIYEDEKVLFQENAACTLYGASDSVTALAHDSDTALLHVGTSAGRSVFQGLRRVSNTTTAVGTAISASGGLVVEE